MIITKFELNLNTPGTRNMDSLADMLEMCAKDIRDGCSWGIIGATRNSWSIDVEYGREDDEEDE